MADAKDAKPAAAAEGEPKKIEKVDKPNQNEYDSKVADIDKKIADVGAKIEKIGATMREHKRGMSGLMDAIKRAKRDIENLTRRPEKSQKECAALREKAKAIEAIIAKKSKANQKVKDELRSFMNTKDKNIQRAIGDQIKRLEREMQTEVMSMKEEKNMLKRISELRSMRRRAGELKIQSTRRDEDNLKDLKAMIARKSGDVSRSAERIAAKEEFLEKKNAELEAEKAKGFTALEEKRNKLREKKKELQKSKRALGDAFWDQKRAYRKYTDELRNLRRAEEKKEREAWYKQKEEERLAWEKELEKQKPWLEEIAQCDMLIEYLDKVDPTKEKKKVVVAEKKTSYTLEDGTVIEAMGKFGKEDLSGVSNPYGKKKKKKKRKKKKNFLREDRPLHFGFELLNVFRKMKVPVPHYPDDVPESIKVAKEQRAMWDTKPRAKKKTPKKKAEKKDKNATADSPAIPTPAKEEMARLMAAGEADATAEAAEAAAATPGADEDSTQDAIASRTEELLAAARKRNASKSVDARTEELLKAARERHAAAAEGGEDEADDGEFDENKCYDDDACLGEEAPKLSTLKMMQGENVDYSVKPTVVLFWAKFLKWQVFPAMKYCQELHEAGDVQVIGVATDPKESSVSRHIQKGECPTTYGLAFDAPQGTGKPGAVKGGFKAVCDDVLVVPQVFLVGTDGNIAWRQPFSAGFPLADSNFDAQVKRIVAGEPLAMFGPAPEEEEEEDNGEGEDVVDLVDPLAADVQW